MEKEAGVGGTCRWAEILLEVHDDEGGPEW